MPDPDYESKESSQPEDYAFTPGGQRPRGSIHLSSGSKSESDWVIAPGGGGDGAMCAELSPNKPSTFQKACGRRCVSVVSPRAARFGELDH
jgi:hypothetical protein